MTGFPTSWAKQVMEWAVGMDTEDMAGYSTWRWRSGGVFNMTGMRRWSGYHSTSLPVRGDEHAKQTQVYISSYNVLTLVRDHTHLQLVSRRSLPWGLSNHM